MKYSIIAAFALVLLGGCQDAGVLEPTMPAAAKGGSARAPDVKDRFIVKLRPGADPSAVVRDHGIRADYVYSRVFNGFAGSVAEAARTGLMRDGRVESVERDQLARGDELVTQSGATWGLDRVDQRNRPLDGSYRFVRTGAGTTIYVVDSGINYSHAEFGGRAVFGFDAYGEGGEDCNGHGTHVAGTIGSAQYGVAKGAAIVAVRVLDCTATGTYSAVIAGLDWVVANATRPAVVNLSLGGTASERLDAAVQSVADAGFLPVVSAGNSSEDACLRSPARLPVAATVGATDEKDARASFSNFGSCLDLFAPGVSITSTYGGGSTATAKMSGTSMAAPHVTGAASLYLQGDPSADPTTVRDALHAWSTKGVVTNSSSQNNHLVYSVDDALIGTEPDSDNVAPRARFASSCGAATCTFTDLSTDSDGTIATWIWNFGDGATSSAQSPTHTYTVSGNYTVRLKITDDDGAISTASKTISIKVPVGNSAPTAQFTHACTGGACTFTDQSTDSDGTVVGWSWSFGDGGTSTSRNPSHGYTTSGDYLVRLTATDDDGATHSVSRTITVSVPVPNAAPTAQFTHACTGGACTFTDQSTDSDGTVVGWSWNFGDGGTSTSRNPSHGYTTSGDYLVRLMATDDDGATHSVSRTITVSVSPPNAAPSAKFTDSCSLLTCAFTDLSTDPDGTIETWAWSFGEEGTSAERNPTYTFTSAGSYLVRLKITDNRGGISTASKTVTVAEVANTAPRARFSYACTGRDCTFTDLSTDSDGTVSTWSWNFGDGTTSTQQNPTHRFAGSGSYTVRLKITDNLGAISTASTTVTIATTAGNRITGQSAF